MSGPGMETRASFVRRDLDVVPWGNSRRALAREPKPISNRLEWGFLHHAGRYRHGRCSFPVKLRDSTRRKQYRPGRCLLSPPGSEL